MPSPSASEAYRVADTLMAEKRFSEALNVYSGLASDGDTWAQCQVGWMHQEGVGVPKNSTLALQWFERAASLGSAQGTFYCGRVAAEQSRWDEAIKAFRRGAENEYGPALLWLGLIFIRGYGVEADLKKGLSFLERSAETGNYYARRELAMRMIKGKLGLRKIPAGLALLVGSVVAGVYQYISVGRDDRLNG